VTPLTQAQAQAMGDTKVAGGGFRFVVRSLSPAYWYVADAVKAAREKSRGQVGRPYCSRVEAERAALALRGAA